jgi:hypothetical protein
MQSSGAKKIPNRVIRNDLFITTSSTPSGKIAASLTYIGPSGTH